MANGPPTSLACWQASGQAHTHESWLPTSYLFLLREEGLRWALLRIRAGSLGSEAEGLPIRPQAGAKFDKGMGWEAVSVRAGVVAAGCAHLLAEDGWWCAGGGLAWDGWIAHLTDSVLGRRACGKKLLEARRRQGVAAPATIR